MKGRYAALILALVCCGSGLIFAFLNPPKAGGLLSYALVAVSYSLVAALVAGIVLVCWVIPIWISLKAKPLADKPYRWGTYVGVGTGLIGIAFLLIAFSATDVYGKLALAVLGLCAILCCIGILRRRKFGAVMFVITYLALMSASPLLAAVRNQPVTAPQQGQAVPVLMFLVTTTIYFDKRWRLMGCDHTDQAGSSSNQWKWPTRWGDLQRGAWLVFSVVCIFVAVGIIGILPPSGIPQTHKPTPTTVTQASPATEVLHPVQPSTPPSPPNPQQILQDPNFQALPIAEKHKVLLKTNPDYAALDPKEQSWVLDALQRSANEKPDVQGLVQDPQFQALGPPDQRKVLFALTNEPAFDESNPQHFSDEDTAKFISALSPKSLTNPIPGVLPQSNQQARTQAGRQERTPTDNTSLAKPVDGGIFTARLFPDSRNVSFALATSWIPGENHKGTLRYKLDVFDATPIYSGSNAPEEVDAREKLMLRVGNCSITLNLYDADKFVLRKIPVSFALGVDDQARGQGLNANDSVQMDVQEYRNFIGTSKGSRGSWKVSWSCGPPTVAR